MKYKKKPGEIYCCKEDIFLETYEPVLERE